MKSSILCFMLVVASASYANSPVMQITFQVKNDWGQAVTGAPVTVSTFRRWVPGPEFGRDQYDEVTASTDSNGQVVLKLPSKTGEVRFWVSGDFDGTDKMECHGKVYYVDRGGIFCFTNYLAGQWHPWNPTVEIELKPVVNPIPMYARKYGVYFSKQECESIPEYDKPIGFDLIKGDWVAPYGMGVVADFVFTLSCKLGGLTAAGYQIHDATLTLSFSNEGDGIQPYYVHPLSGSALRLPRFAPESGYTNILVLRSYLNERGSYYESREDQNYFFRVRTKTDESGRIVSALYGKIHGAIEFGWNRSLEFTYYLNPTPNDRNLEFDPKRNLFTDLKPGERVYDP